MNKLNKTLFVSTAIAFVFAVPWSKAFGQAINPHWPKYNLVDEGSGFRATLDVGTLTANRLITFPDGAVDFTALIGETRVSVGELSLGGSNDPGTAIVGTSFVYSFDDGSDKEVFYDLVLPTTYKDGEDITVAICQHPSDNTAGNVVWVLEYNVSTPNTSDALDDATTTTTVTESYTATTQYQHYSIQITISGTGVQSSDVVHIRLFRDGDAGADTYSASALLSSIRASTPVDFN